ncbi:cupredoxin domain-containing protein [Pelagibacterium sediminicola]|uniref:cupredoxin domain-containing protein n=1 Tax=Pelagibacterium sediminicola TaxID=2248761 RepID=UPI000E3225C4|nr:plastocyanin/azurin family copper-binding protein [Pelagibacterium sediminicola]
MSPTRRTVLGLGSGAVAAALLSGWPARAQETVTIAMKGSPRGESAWFEPNAIAVPVGARVRFVNEDAGNSHTATAYHPDVFGRARRIPSAAVPWDSGFLLPGESFEVVLSAPGVYDYYCIPHEMHGMVGRIVVGAPGDPGWEGEQAAKGDLPVAAQAGLVPVDEIVAAGPEANR